jgi:hypothetical protein
MNLSENNKLQIYSRRKEKKEKTERRKERKEEIKKARKKERQLEGRLAVHLPLEIMWNYNLMQLGNFINIFLAQHVSGTYAHHQEH